LWTSATGATPADVDRWWQAFLRRFDLEHTFRLLKQTLGWTTATCQIERASVAIRVRACHAILGAIDAPRTRLAVFAASIALHSLLLVQSQYRPPH
jgi:hypothetical protein